MKNSLGNSLILTIFGESHGEIIGAVLDGLCPGLQVDDVFIRSQLAKRRPSHFFETSRIEKDEYKIVSGVFNGYTTGAPLTILIPNEDKKSSDWLQGPKSESGRKGSEDIKRCRCSGCGRFYERQM